jgi:pyruvate,water dikinase
VVAADAFRSFLESCGGTDIIAALTRTLNVNDAAAVEEVSRRIRNLIATTPLPPSLADAIERAHEQLEHRDLVAVRSSAVAEDGNTASFAGQQETYLNVRGIEDVLRRVQECWASFFSPRALFYRAQKAVLSDTRMAVVVQEMVPADKSGVMFTVDPIRRRFNCMVIEAAPGLGDAVVSGEIIPEHYVVARDDAAIVDEYVPDEGDPQVLQENDLRRLCELGLRLERLFGSPQDVEWCLRSGDLLLLQSRPITTLEEESSRANRNDTQLLELGRRWVVDHYPYNSTHLLKSLDWLDRIAPDASEAVRLATLTHDMERAFGGPDAIPIVMNDPGYEKAHSDRSARIVGDWLRGNRADPSLVLAVEDLIRVHEWGGWPDADLVQAADSLSFLETNIELMIGFVQNGKYPAAHIALKFDQMYDRIRVPAAKENALPMWKRAKARLEGL